MIVADASPLIFLSKLNRLDLLKKLFASGIVVPGQIQEELLAKKLPPDEMVLLERFLSSCTVQVETKPRSFSKGLSEADSAALTLAIREQALLVVDDAALRRMAKAHGLTVLGTLGLLLLGVRKDILTPATAKAAVHELVEEHSFRISIEVYDAIMSRLNDEKGRMEHFEKGAGNVQRRGASPPLVT